MGRMHKGWLGYLPQCRRCKLGSEDILAQLVGHVHIVRIPVPTSNWPLAELKGDRGLPRRFAWCSVSSDSPNLLP